MNQTDVTVEALFEAIGHAGFGIARGIREGDIDLGERASSALLNALAMLPQELRDSCVSALTDRSQLAPALQVLAL